MPADDDRRVAANDERCRRVRGENVLAIVVGEEVINIIVIGWGVEFLVVAIHDVCDSSSGIFSEVM